MQARLEEITRLTLIRSRRASAARLEARAVQIEKKDVCILGQNAASLRVDAIIARWEADTIERDGKLPDAYLDILP